MGVGHLSGATAVRASRDIIWGCHMELIRGGGIWESGDVCKYVCIQTYTHLFLKPEPRYLIVAVCDVPALDIHLENQSVLTAVN